MNNKRRPIGNGLRALFGDLSWRPPGWASRLNDKRRREPRRFWTGALLLVLMPALIWAGYRVWQALPKPVETEVSIRVPDLTRVGEDGTLYPQPLYVNFNARYKDARQQGSRGAGRLDLLHKPVTRGITLSPEMPGEWHWVNENRLRFKPEQDWPAGQTYRVRMQQDIFADGVILEDPSPEFTTREIQVSLDKLDFYQNPEKPTEHRVVATLSFTHGVNRESLREHLTLGMRPSGAAITESPTPHEYSLELGRQGREAYIQSRPLRLPPEDNFMTLTVSPGVEADRGPSTTDGDIEQRVRVPSVATYFRVRRMDARIVRNENNDPEQTLVIQFTDGVETEVVADSIRAWVLPEDRHYRRNQISENLKQRSEALTLHSNPSEHRYSELQSFRFRAPENRQLLIELPAGLVSQGGFEMTVPRVTLERAPPYPREAQVVGGGALLAMSGDRKLSLQSRGVPGLEVELYRLQDNQVNHLISQTHGNLEKADFRSYHFSEENISERFTRHITLEAEHPGKAVYASLDLAPWLKDAGRGIFVVNVSGWDPQTKRTLSGARDRRLVLVSDMAVIAKDYADGRDALFVHSLGRQGPVAGARVSLLGRNGEAVGSATTDSQGKALFPDFSDLENERQPTVWLVRHNGDIAFLPFSRRDRELNFSRFDVGGLRTGGRDASETLRAAVFSDRGIYRPGEDGHVGIMVKRADWQPVTGAPVEMTLTDPRGKQVSRELTALPADGFVEQPLSFAGTDPTGDYQFRVYLYDDTRNHRRQLLGSTRISVEEFQPDSMRIHTAIEGGEARGWRTLNTYQARVSLENLFGLPAQKRRVEADYSLSPTAFRFDDYPGFVFQDPFRDQDDRLERSISRDLPEGTSGEDGEAVFDIDLSRYGGGLFQLRFSARGYEPDGGRSVSARSSTRVSPAQRLLGWKSDGALRYLRRDSERNVRFVMVDPQLKSLRAEALTLKLIEKKKLSTLMRQDDGTLAYQTITRREPVSEKAFTVAAGGTDWTLPTDTPGDFVAEVRDTDGRLLASLAFSVVGNRNLAGELEKNAELGIKLDRDDYRAGDTIEMQITAPYAGAGLITIERDRVYAHKWFRADTSRSVQRIQVPAGLEGNGYVNVTFVRALDSDEVFTNPLSYAVAPFDVDRDARTVRIELSAPDKVKPGEELAIDVSTSQSSRVAVFAVDEGILQVADYNTPDPLDTFLQKRALEVGTAQMADLLMPEFRLLQQAAAAGGGDRLAREPEAGANLNPFQRGIKAPVVFWSGILDVTGEKRRVSFRVPDHFDGELRLMAVASGDRAAGSTSQRTTVRGPFVLQPNVITTAAPGDEFQVSVGVTNALPEGSGEQPIRVSVEHGEHLEILGETTRTLTLAPGREDRARFRVRATDRPGGAELVFRARAGDQSLTRTATLSVRPAVPRRTTLNAGMSEDSGETRLTRQLRPQLAEQSATLGHSPLILAGGLHQYLDQYPHGCTEQLVSRVFPVLGLTQDPALRLDRDAVLANYREAVQTLRARQQPDGGFGFWPGVSRTDNFVSLYAMHFLTEATEQSVSVPRDVLATGLDFLRRVAVADPAAGQRAYEQAYAIYLLTRNGRVTTNYLTRLQEYLEKHRPDDWRHSLAAAYMAASYAQLKLDDLAGGLIDGYRFAEPGSDYELDMDSALARNSQYVYLLARHFPQRLDRLDEARIRKLVDPISDRQFNTLSASYTVLALGAWGSQAGANAEGMLKIAARRGEALETLVEARPPVAHATLPADTSAVHFTGEGRLFHTAVQSGYDRALPTEPLSNGLEITRVYLNDDGDEVTSATQGEELTVRLRMRALDNRRHDNVAVVELLPGGFEIQRDSVRRQSGWSADYADIREDRLVLYGSITPGVRTFSYRVRATGAGQFKMPPAFAESMYHPDLHGHSAAGSFRVTEP